MTDPTSPDSNGRPHSARPPGYRSYLLRFWEERGEQSERTVWRLSLEDPLTDQRHGFASLEALVAWLQSEIAGPRNPADDAP